MYEFIQTKTGWKICFGPLPKTLMMEAAQDGESSRVMAIRKDLSTHHRPERKRLSSRSEALACELALAG